MAEMLKYLLLVLWLQWTAGSDGTSGFPTLVGVATRAARLHHLQPHYSETSFYPSLAFECSGTLSRLWLVVRPFIPSSEVTNTNGLRLSLWRSTVRPSDQDTSQGETQSDSDTANGAQPDDLCDLSYSLSSPLSPMSVVDVEDGERDLRLLEFQLASPVSFMEGDILRIDQMDNLSSPSPLMFQNGGRPQRHLQTTDNVRRVCLQEDDGDRSNDYPLIAFDIAAETAVQSSGECGSGFLSVSELKRIIVSYALGSKLTTIKSPEHRLLLPPLTSFTCAGRILKWTVVLQGVDQIKTSDIEHAPQLQVWNRKANIFKRNSSTLLISTSLIATEQAYVYDIIPREDIVFMEGDILGVFVPPDATVPELFLKKEQRATHIAHEELPDEVVIQSMEECSDPVTSALSPDCANPLVAVKAKCVSSCPRSCTNGFIEQEDLISLATLVGPVVYGHQITTIMQSLKFNEDGSVAAWFFAARREAPGPEKTGLPHIQIWRPGSEEERDRRKEDVLENYKLVGSTQYNNPEAQETDWYNVYSYVLNAPMEVRAGDVVGVLQPAQDISQLSLAFLEGAGPQAGSILLEGEREVFMSDEDAKRQARQPLISVKFQPASVTSPSSTTSTVPSNTTTTGGGGSSGASSTVAVGVAVGMVLLVILVALIILVLVGCLFWRRRMRKNTYRDTTRAGEHLANPSYETTIEIDPAENTINNSSQYTTVSESQHSAASEPDYTGISEPQYSVPVRGSTSTGGQIYATVLQPQMYEVPLLSPVNGRLTPNCRTVGEAEGKGSEEIDDGMYQVVKPARLSGVLKDVDHGKKEGEENDYHVLENPEGEKEGEENDYHVLENPEGESEETNQMRQHLKSTSSHHKPPIAPKPRTMSNISKSDSHYNLFVPSNKLRQTLDQQGSLTNSSLSTTTSSDDVYTTLHKAQSGQRVRSVSSSSTTSSQFFEESTIYWRPASHVEAIYEQLSCRRFRELPRHQLQITEHLGAGQFGTVNKGVWQAAKGPRTVAVKMLQSNAPELDTVSFLQEAAIMGQFRHPNIVQLVGVVTVGKPLMIVLELLTNGDLTSYLHQHHPVPGELPYPALPQLLLSFCQQVSSGMAYLSGKSFIHRDLAARNILVSHDRVCKIGDFGMARDLEESNYYITKGGKIPVKWTAPEAVNFKKYSTASDVWSFGVVMYEIWSLGHKPFEEKTIVETVELINSGYCLPPPPGCPQGIYSLMVRCWHPTASFRPSFSRLHAQLTSNEGALLAWPSSELEPEMIVEPHPQAGVLGAGLDAGQQLHAELQNTYSS